MKRIGLILIGVVIGILLSLLYFEKQKNKNIHTQSHTLLQNIKKLNKMVVTEAYFNEVYSHKDSDTYLFDMLQFDKNVILLVNAKVQISYDLSKMKVALDSVHKIIKLTQLPQEQVEVFPDIKYYDIQQSTFNSFTAEELNAINQKAIEQIKQHIDLKELRLKAKKQLLDNLQNIYILSQVYGWKVEDNHYMQNLHSDLLLY